MQRKPSLCFVLVLPLLLSLGPPGRAGDPPPRQVLAGVKDFFKKTARPDGSFRPGVDPDYPGMSDSAYSDLAPTVYAVVLHRTFGRKLPHEAKTKEFLLARQGKAGRFFNISGPADSQSDQARAHHT